MYQHEHHSWKDTVRFIHHFTIWKTIINDFVLAGISQPETMFFFFPPGLDGWGFPVDIAFNQSIDTLILQSITYIYIYTFSSWKNYIWQYIYIYTGWWFGTFSIFPSIGNNHPNWLSYFSEGWPKTTNQYMVVSNEMWCHIMRRDVSDVSGLQGGGGISRSGDPGKAIIFSAPKSQMEMGWWWMFCWGPWTDGCLALWVDGLFGVSVDGFKVSISRWLF